MTLKITLDFYFLHTEKNMEVTLKNIYKGNYIDDHTEIVFPLLFKDTEITLKKINHTNFFSVTQFFCSQDFQCYLIDFQCDFECHSSVVNTILLQKYLD